MLRQKPLVISLALAGLIVSTELSALGMGRLNVTTALGQPLVAEVHAVGPAAELAGSGRDGHDRGAHLRHHVVQEGLEGALRHQCS